MAQSHWHESLLPPTATLREALSALNTSAMQIVLAVDAEGRLVGCATDGDVRRALLSGADLSESIDAFLRRNPVTVGPADGVRTTRAVMAEHGVGTIPIVDNAGRVVGLRQWTDLLSRFPRREPVLIMAGGKGVRLHPFTQDTPKPLVSVRGEPMIEILLKRLAQQGFINVWVSVHHMANRIMEHLGDGERFGMSIQYIEEPEPLGTAGALGLWPSPPSAPVLVLNADLLTAVDFSEILDYHVASKSAATLAMRRHVTELPFAEVLHNQGRVEVISEKPSHEHWINAGIYVIDQPVLALLEALESIDMPDLLNRAIDQGLPVSAFELDGYWLDLGTPVAIQQAENDAAAPLT